MFCWNCMFKARWSVTDREGPSWWLLVPARSHVPRLLLLLLLLTPGAAWPEAPTRAARPLVMFDPGHGGTNLGARGTTIEPYEKTLTLAICRQAAVALRRLRPDLRVVLTRTKDRYLTLAQRVRLANAAQASLFISVHLNASVAQNQKGFEVFILDREASDRDAAALALRERDPVPDGSKRDRGAVVQAILGDLQHMAAHARSLDLARAIRRELATVRGEALDRGIRQAPFDVLMGLTMPAVLAELGFIDHAEEGPELADPILQRRLGEALAHAADEQLGPLRPGPSRPRRPPTH